MYYDQTPEYEALGYRVLQIGEMIEPGDVFNAITLGPNVASYMPCDSPDLEEPMVGQPVSDIMRMHIYVLRRAAT
jgi:hypothetical protein